MGIVSESIKYRTIKFTRDKAEKFRKSYNAAKSDGKETFTFEGHELLTKYAAYIVEYLDMKF